MRHMTAFCNRCQLLASMPVQASVTGPVEWIIVECPGCGERVLMSEHASNWGDHVAVFQLHPKSDQDARRVPAHMPDRVERIFREALVCLQAGAPQATAVMVGRCIEAIGREEQVREGAHDSLYGIIDRLAEKGRIAKNQAEWAHLLRVLRNDGAHDNDFEVTTEDAADAVTLLETLCVSLYTHQRGFLELRARREERRANPRPAAPAPALAPPRPTQPPPASPVARGGGGTGAIGGGADDDIPF